MYILCISKEEGVPLGQSLGKDFCLHSPALLCPAPGIGGISGPQLPIAGHRSSHVIFDGNTLCLFVTSSADKQQNKDSVSPTYPLTARVKPIFIHLRFNSTSIHLTPTLCQALC